MESYRCALSQIRTQIAVNSGDNCVRNGVSLTEGREASETFIVCGKQGCTFVCRGHATCLRQWEVCAETRLQQLINAAAVVTLNSADPNVLIQFSSSLTTFRLLFVCPNCAQPRLCLARISSTGSLEAKKFGSILDEVPSIFRLIHQVETNSIQTTNSCLSELQLASHFYQLFAHCVSNITSPITITTTNTATKTNNIPVLVKQGARLGTRPEYLRFSDTCPPSNAISPFAMLKPPYSAGQFCSSLDPKENVFFPQISLQHHHHHQNHQQMPAWYSLMSPKTEQRFTPTYKRKTSLNGTVSGLSSGFVSGTSNCSSSRRSSKPEGCEEFFPTSLDQLSSSTNQKQSIHASQNEATESRPRSGSMVATSWQHSSQQRDEQRQSNRRVDPKTGQIMRSLSINLASLYQKKKEKETQLQQQQQHNSKGNIFRQRKDFSAFQTLHPSKMNGYFIQLEDDSCTGNEDTRSFLLCQLTNHRASELACLACGVAMHVYDHFPVVDGALFLSPFCHRGGLQVVWNSPNSPSSVEQIASPGQVFGSSAPPPGCTGPRQQHSLPGGIHHRQRLKSQVYQERYLHAICLSCMRSTTTTAQKKKAVQIVCRFCTSPWNGATLLIGGMYTYDLFASTPCCSEHLKCKSCSRMVLSTSPPHASTQRTPKRTESYPAIFEFSPTDAEERAASVHRLSDGAQEQPGSLTPLLPLPFFSQYSNLICCQHCRAVDYHFIKPFDEMYTTIIDPTLTSSSPTPTFI